MLEQKQKQDLQAITDKYDLNHLRPSSQIYSLTLQQQDRWLISENQESRRKIFWNVQYTPKQQQALANIKSKLQDNDIFEKFTQALILKHWYAAKHDVDGTVARLKSLQQIYWDPVVTKYTKTTQQYLKKGLIYTYGYDKKFKPVVISQNYKINYQLSMEENININYYFLLMLRGFKFTPGYAQRCILICDLKDVEYGSIPKYYVYKMMKKFSVLTCDLSQKIYILNSQKLATVWSFINRLIPQNTKKKIIFIKNGEEYKLRQDISPYQLEQKYGGKLPNLTEYFPPSSPEQLIEQSKYSQVSQTVYDSILNDSINFTEQVNNSCCGNSTCQIF